MALIDSLVAYWKLEEASGSRADSVGANTLTDNNTVTQAAGKIGNCADFEVGTVEYLSIVDNTALSMGDIDFMMAAWVQLESEPATAAIIGKWLGSTSNRGYALYYSGGATDRFLFQVSNDGVAVVTVTANNFGAVSTATWYWVVGYHDSVNNVIGISVNNGTANTTAHTTGVFNDAADFVLGGFAGGLITWDGLIDEVGIWKRILTASELTFLYNAGAGRAYPFAIGPIQSIARRPASLIRASTR